MLSGGKVIKAIAINGSPRRQRGNTALLLSPLIQGMSDAGCEVELFYARNLKVRSCNCPNMYCWYSKPGTCCLRDDMDLLYPKLRESEIVIIATPVYIPLPGEMQNIINRLCPLIKPLLETRKGRTRAGMRDDVRIRGFLLLSTGGWWEEGNFDTVTRIVEELAEDAKVKFLGAIIRPHAFLMRKDKKLTEDGKMILAAVRKAGEELISKGAISRELLETIKRPLITEKELLDEYNRWVE